MPDPQNLRATGDRIEQLLDQLQATAEPRTCGLAEDILRLVTELYGGGLARVVEIVREADPELMKRFLEDDLVASLLLVHGLHPESLESRVESALARVRPFLATHAGNVELLGLDPDAGSVRLRLLGSCDGCPSSAVTLQMAVERSILEAAPEIVRIDVDEPSRETAMAGAPHSTAGISPSSAGGRSVPIALSTKPLYEACPAEVSSG